jgi:alpha/beta superfamily hydrolase
MEEKITVDSGPCRLEGYWQAGTAGKAVVIAHPHPLYGGSMRNPVVETIQGAYQQHGYATLRFNFRGVGGSQGRFDNGIGEKDDVRAAVAHVESLQFKAIDLAGYSFGAWVNAGLAVTGFPAIHSMLMVSPPVAFIAFDRIGPLKCLKLVITGSRDEIAPAAHIRDLLPAWNPDAGLEIIDGCDHFYAGHREALQAILSRYLKSRESQAP